MTGQTRTQASARRPSPRGLGRRLFVVAGVACGGAWITKQAAIALNCGEASLVEGVLWAAGLLGLLTWAAAGSALLLAGRPWWQRAVAAGLAVPVALMLNDMVDALAKSVYPGEGWMRDELGLVLVGLAVLAGTALARPLSSAAGPTAPAGAEEPPVGA